MRVLLFALLVGMAAALAQDDSTSTTSSPRRDQWIADMPAGKYIVRLSAITSISRHEYIVDAAARVTEVNISTTGTELVRFYYIEPLVPQAPNGIGQSVLDKAEERARDVAARVSAEDVWQKVVKNYPTTTHARTIEYRLASKDQLSKLFESIERSFTTRQPGVFKP